MFHLPKTKKKILSEALPLNIVIKIYLQLETPFFITLYHSNVCKIFNISCLGEVSHVLRGVCGLRISPGSVIL